MSILKRIKRSFVYHTTSKPVHYVHVDKPKSLQDHRQIQYNDWCKRNAVYNGSYLPKDPVTLLRKGWSRYVNHQIPKDKNNEFIRKSSGQIVRYDHKKKDIKSGEQEDEHYHWYNDSRKTCMKAPLNDRYGKLCCKIKAPESHLAPLDKDYNFRKH